MKKFSPKCVMLDSGVTLSLVLGFSKKYLDRRTTQRYTLTDNIMLYNKEDKSMVQQISDAELEIMKIVWGNPEKVTRFPYIMDGLAARGRQCQKQ